MFRKLIAILFILIGLVGVAGGVWGTYTVKTNEAVQLNLALIDYSVACEELNQIPFMKGFWTNTISPDFSQVKPQVDENGNVLVEGSEAVLNTFSNILGSVDSWLSEKTGTSLSQTIVNQFGEEYDISDASTLNLLLCRYNIEILLGGIILMQFGLLLWAWSRRS